MDFDKPKVYGDTSITDGLVFIALSESVYGLMPGSGYQEQIWLNGHWLEGYFIPQPSWLD